MALTPGTALLMPGKSLQLEVVANYYGGKPALGKPTTTYSSSVPAVATVSSTGLVTALGPGTTEIEAAMTVSGDTRSGRMTVQVRLAPDGTGALLFYHPQHGWEPSVTQSVAGESVAWLGPPNSLIWIMDTDLRELETLKLDADGFATHRFETEGTFHFCTGSCWDASQWGRVVVEDPANAGVYDLTATILSFDSAWGDLSGHAYTAVLTLLQLDEIGRAGTFTNHRLLDSQGRSLSWPPEGMSGYIEAYIDFRGRLIFDLRAPQFTWTAIPDAIAASGAIPPTITGTFGCCGHISGTFVAERRTP